MIVVCKRCGHHIELKEGSHLPMSQQVGYWIVTCDELCNECREKGLTDARSPYKVSSERNQRGEQFPIKGGE